MTDAPRSDSQLADILEDWLAIDSVTPNEARLLELLERQLEARGYTCTRQPYSDDRWNLLATRGEDAAPRLLYSTHVDTVPPHLPVRRDAEAVYGRGACDTRGGIVAMIEAGDRLLDEGYDRLGYLFVVGEEVDHCGAKLARQLDLAPERIILCEPTKNRVVSAQKGMVKAVLTAEGVAAHSAYPERGASATRALVDTLHALQHEDWPVDETLGTTDVNIGVISGGVAANVMAPSARAEILIRTVLPFDEMARRIESLCGERVTVETMLGNDPVFFEPPEGVETTTVRFNTDATYLAELGPIWLVGPGDIEFAHSDHEHIRIQELGDGARLYTRLGRLALDETS
jgi:acetylornithine deacetylase